MPEPKVLPNTNILLPHVFLGDEAFPLLDNLLKPFQRPQATVDKTKAIFNYRLSRARRLVENSFGISVNRFRIFLTTIDLNISTVENLVTSACIIHNLIVDETKTFTTDDTEHEISELISEEPDIIDNENHPDELNACRIRNLFKDYFNGAGAVHWQSDLLGFNCN